MKRSIVFRCAHCKRLGEAEVKEGRISCPSCAKEAGKIENIDTLFDHCPLCQCRQFYVSKDFNQGLGCLILVIGALLVPVTYGLSLPLFALADWLLYKRVPAIACCYRCSAFFRGLDPPKHLKPFSHHTGLQYDKIRP